MDGRMKRGIVGVLVVAGIVVGGIAWQHRSAAPLAPVAVITAPPPAPALAPQSRPQPRPVLPASVPLGADAPGVGVQVERLLASHDPRQAFTAYWLVSGCASFNAKPDFDRYDDKLRANRPLNADEKRNLGKMCGGLTERERQSRLDYLAIPVKAGLPGAAWQFAVEGPFGDPTALTTRPDDPLVKEWKAKAVAQLNDAAAGDPSTLIVWSMQNLGGTGLADKNPALAYRYLTAFGMMNADQFGPNNPTAKMYGDGSAMMETLPFGLTPEQRAAEQAEARRIADEAKRRRRQREAAPLPSLA